MRKLERHYWVKYLTCNYHGTVDKEVRYEALTNIEADSLMDAYYKIMAIPGTIEVLEVVKDRGYETCDVTEDEIKEIVHNEIKKYKKGGK